MGSKALIIGHWLTSTWE